MENSEQIKRIARMEEVYDRSRLAVEEALSALERYAQVESELRALEAYYTGGRWMTDFDADRAGRIPQDMKRGILTEDAIYDLLIDQDRMKALMRRLTQANEA